MRSPALWAYLAASRLAGPAAGPLLGRRLARGREDALRLGERLGRAGRPRPEGRLTWLHAASVGEAGSALPLVGALRARGLAVLVTTGTVASARRMAAALPEGALHQFAPVDTAAAVRGFLDHWRPDLAIWVESELWPRLVVETARRGVPMALVNARLSEASFRRWRLAPGMARRLLGSFRAILAQDEETVSRLRALGAGARFAGNLKALVEGPGCDAAELAAIRGTLGERPVWLAASTHAGEEEAVIAAHRALGACSDRLGANADRRHARAGGDLVGQGGDSRLRGNDVRAAGSCAPSGRLSSAVGQDALASVAASAEASPASDPCPRDRGADSGQGTPNLSPFTGEEGAARPLLILAPRHPDRGDEIARLIAEAGLSATRRSCGEIPGSGTDVWLADTMGEMGLWYRLATAAFVGGSLSPAGGHTPFEPVALGCAVLHGPHVANFAPVYAALDGAGGALRVSGPAELAAALRGLLSDAGLAEGLCARARAVHAALRPDLEAIADELSELMEART